MRINPVSYLGGTFAKLLTESAIRMLDANADGVEDVVMGFATGQCVQSDGVDLSSRHFV